MTKRGEHTLREILSQPAVWAQSLQAYDARASQVESLWQREQVEQVLFIGCGSTHYLSMSAAVLFQALNAVPSQAQPASEILLHPESIILPGRKTFLVAVSRSGETTETVRAVEYFREEIRGPILAITCYANSALAKLADMVLVAEGAQEESIAQTRSFTSMLILAIALAGHLSGQADFDVLESLPEHGDRLFTSYRDLARMLGENKTIEQTFFLGSGELYGTACEAMLKLKEMSLSHSEAFYPLEFRHGPMSMVNKNTLTIGLISDVGQEHELAVLEQMRALGSQVLILASEGRSMSGGEGVYMVHLTSKLPPWARSPLYLPVLQLMAYYRAMARGLDPDRPTNLDAVVRLDRLGC